MNDPSHRTPNNLFRLLAYIRPYWPFFALATLCGIVKFLVPVINNVLVGRGIDVLTAAYAGDLPRDAAWGQVTFWALLGMGLAAGSALPVYLRSRIGARAVWSVVRDLRCDLYAHIQKLSHSFFDAHRSGSLTSRIIGDVEAVQPFLNQGLIQSWMNVVQITVVMSILFSQNVKLALLSMALIPFHVVVQRLLSWRVKANARAIRDQLAGLAGATQEKLAASTVVKTFTREDDEVQRFSEDSNSLIDLGIYNSHLNGLSQAAVTGINALAPLLILLIGGHIGIFQPGELSIGLIAQFILMQGQVYGPFERLNEMQLITANALGATDRIFEIFDTEPEIADRPGAVKAPRVAGDIRVSALTFRYPDALSPALADFTLHIPARTTTALVGPSGGGKTTVTHLLNRFYDWEAGSIAIDGRDIRDYTVYSLRAQVGLVPQDPMLFSGTIEENILYGRPDATSEEVRRAAEQAYALGFIEELDQGFNTMLGERGIKLSGGQKQRIAIARAFLKDPAILILDEATSALDSESERIVQQALEALMRDRTTLVIAHRLATVIRADQIAVIERGRVAECGRHAELLACNGLYAMLCRQQFGAQLPGLPALD